MFVCICHGVTDTEINESIDQGLKTMRCLSGGLNVGTECGQCVKATKRILSTKLVDIDSMSRIAAINACPEPIAA